MGYTPWYYVSSEEETIFENDKTLGWISKSGEYQITASDKFNEKTNLTILDNGERYSGSNKSKNNLIIIGGSFSQGWGVNNSQTYSFNLQNFFINHKVHNFGQSGYGGVQSFLLLKEKIKTIRPTNLVIYGFIDHHEYRNVARSGWLSTLLKYSKSGHSDTPKVPYADINKMGHIIFKEPIGYIKMPFRESLAIVALIEKTYMKQKTKKRKKIQKEVTKKIFLKMKEISKKNGSEFLAVNLKSNFIEYKNFLKENKINYVDCNLQLTKKYLLRGDYHPNGAAHSFYSECIAKYIKNKKLLF